MFPAWLMSAQPPLRPWLGMFWRIVVGVFITASIVILLNLPDEPAAWSVIACVVVIGFSAGASSVAAVNRLQGSIVGCLTGGIVQMLLADWLWLPIVAATAVGLSLIFCRLLRIGAGFRLGGALAGFFVFVPGSEEWATVGWRLLATAIGIGVGVGIMLLVPVRSDEKVRKGLASTLADCILIVQSALARWCGESDPAELAAARQRVKAGTASVATAISERAFERAGAWEADTYTVLVSDLNDAMVTALRIDRVSQFREQDQMYQFVREPFRAALDECNEVARLMVRVLETGEHDDRDKLLKDAEALAHVPLKIKNSIDEIRAEHKIDPATAEELQRLYGISLLIEHWADSVRQLADDLAASQK